MDGSVCKDENGNLFFGSQNGACYFNPEHIIENVQIAPVKITDIKSYNYSDPSSKGVIVPITDNKVNLSYRSSI